MKELEDKEVEIGDEEIEYDLGDLLNTYGEEMEVKIIGGGAAKFVEYNEETGTLNVNQTKLNLDDVGRWEIEIEASYTNDLGQEVVYDKKIYFTITGEQTHYVPEHKEEEEKEVYYVEDWLSDDTKIANVTWATMKEAAMEPFYNETVEFANLT